MNVYVPWPLLAFIAGAWFGGWWTKAWALHNREAAPVWIPWRCEPCEDCKARHRATEGENHE